MQIPYMHQVISDLAPYIANIREFSQKAWDYYHNELPPKAQVIFSSRSRASTLHDLMIHFANEFVTTNEQARSFERQQMHGIVLLEKYAIRFKKLDEGGKSRNQPSMQVTCFREQTELDGIDAIHNLELGYILDQWQSKIVDVRLVCPSGEANAWAFSLLENEATVATETNIFEISKTKASQTEEIQPTEIEAKKEADVLPFVRKESAD